MKKYNKPEFFVTYLTNFDVITKVAAETGYIADTDVERLIKFRNNPSDESWING